MTDKNMGEAVPKELRDFMARIRGREPSNDPVPLVDLDELFPIGAAIRKKKEAEEAARRELEQNLQIGEYIEGKGIFAGTWEPRDRKVNSLNQTFNIYAARQDIGGNKTFDDTVKHVAAIKDLDGHDGFNHKVSGQGGEVLEDEVLYDALRSGTYAGEWFIPTKDALSGNLYANKDKGELKGTFIGVSSDVGRWYRSCTEHLVSSSFVWSQRFADGGGDWFRKGNCSFSGRLLRAEPRL